MRSWSERGVGAEDSTVEGSGKEGRRGLSEARNGRGEGKGGERGEDDGYLVQ